MLPHPSTYTECRRTVKVVVIHKRTCTSCNVVLGNTIQGAVDEITLQCTCDVHYLYTSHNVQEHYKNVSIEMYSIVV